MPDAKGPAFPDWPALSALCELAGHAAWDQTVSHAGEKEKDFAVAYELLSLLAAQAAR